MLSSPSVSSATTLMTWLRTLFLEQETQQETYVDGQERSRTAPFMTPITDLSALSAEMDSISIQTL